MRIALLADTHGNLVALEAVLAHLRSASPDLVVNLGDLVSGPFDPAASADAQMTLGCPTLAGNHDRQLLTGCIGPSDEFARPRLSQAHLDWLADLPATIQLADGEIFACHGSPKGGDLDYLLENVDSGRAMLDDENAILSRLAGIGPAKVVLCAHSHTSRVVMAGGVLVVNPGSVGMPGYRDSEPVPHVMEAGTPHARYAVLDRTVAGWSAELRAVPYDYEIAATQAERHGRPEVAHAVRTGRMPS